MAMGCPHQGRSGGLNATITSRPFELTAALTGWIRPTATPRSCWRSRRSLREWTDTSGELCRAASSLSDASTSPSRRKGVRISKPQHQACADEPRGADACGGLRGSRARANRKPGCQRYRRQVNRLLREEHFQHPRTAMAMISVRQVKAARALLNWSREDLAESAGISYRTVARIEQIDGLFRGSRETRDAIFAAFRLAGVEFIPTGVQLAVQQKHGAPLRRKGEVKGRRRRS